MLKFEWDTEKAASNLRKHGVSFDEAGSFSWINLRYPARIQIIRSANCATSLSECHDSVACL